MTTYGSLTAVTATGFDEQGRAVSRTDALGNAVFTQYDSLGQTLSLSGATYPVQYAYDTVGRQTELDTTRDGLTWDKTRFLFDGATWLLTNKVYADGSRVVYAYTDVGRLASRTWARNIVTAYSYDTLGQPLTIDYPGTWYDVYYAYDVFGYASSSSNSFARYTFLNSLNGTATNETAVIGTNTFELVRGLDAHNRVEDTDMALEGISLGKTHYDRDTEGRISLVAFTNAVNTGYQTLYGYSDGYASGWEIQLGNGGTFRRVVLRDPHRPGLVTGVSNTVDCATVSAFGYGHDLMGKRSWQEDCDGSATAANAFLYNAPGEVTNAVLGAYACAYDFDNTGNRVRSVEGTVTNTCTANQLNQYDAFTYDADGNMLSGGGLSYLWDAENRLKMATPVSPTNGSERVASRYDHLNRRVMKRVDVLTGHTPPSGSPPMPGNPGEWVEVRSTAFVWDNDRIAAEVTSYTNGVVTTNAYFWGADMSGSVQPEIQKTVAGHTVSMVSSTAVTNTYAYDGFGRRVSATDGRGNTAVTAYNELGQIAYTEDAASNRTSYAYDASGRQNAVTDPLNNTTRTAYDSLGNVIARWGATYPVAYEYDTAGRKTAMYTYRGAGEITDYNSFQSLVSSLDKTVWLYDQPTGLLTNKVFVDDSRVRYTYMEGGRLATRVWARGAVTEYSYDALGQLTNVNYGGSAPGVAYAYDRLGRMLSAISPASYSLYTYTGLALTEEIQDGWLFTRPSDGLGRGAGYALHTPDDHNSPAHSVEYGHNALGQFSFVCSAHSAVSNTFGYAYLDGTDMHEGYTASADTPFLAVAKAYEPDRGLIASVTNSVLSVPFVVSSFVYANNAIGHRLSRVDSGSVTNLFTNNGRGEVTEAVMGAGTYAYGYDDIGNRVFSALDTVTNTYTANSLNQYTQVNGGMSASPAYDLDGNMTFDGVLWRHSWDAENRLVMSEPYGLATNGAVRLNYQYNHRNLQIAKMTERLSGRGAGYPMDPSQPGTWDAVETRRYVWDGYNIAAEIVIDEVTPSTNVTYYTWGLDLSGTLQGAGGVGGLLAETKMTASTTNTYYAFGDANGNVTEYADAAGTVRGHYEYSPFGEITAQSGDLADTFTHRFSTKPYDSVTGQVRYQLRPYKPLLGWLQRDRIGIRGGNNEYGTMGNDFINNWDYLGLTDVKGWKKRVLSDAEGHNFGCEEWKSHKEGFSGVANRSSYVRHFEVKSLGAVNMDKKLKRTLADELVSSIGIPNDDESTLWSMNFRETALYYTEYKKRKDSTCKSGCRYYIEVLMQVVVSEIRSKSGDMIEMLVFTNAGDESKNKVSQTAVHSIGKECVQ